MDPQHIQLGRKAAEILDGWGYPDAGDTMRRGMDAAEAEGRPAFAGSTAPPDDAWEMDYIVDGVTPENTRAWVEAEPDLRDRVIQLYVDMTAFEVAEPLVKAGGEMETALEHGEDVARQRLVAVGL